MEPCALCKQRGNWEFLGLTEHLVVQISEKSGRTISVIGFTYLSFCPECISENSLYEELPLETNVPADQMEPVSPAHVPADSQSRETETTLKEKQLITA